MTKRDGLVFEMDCPLWGSGPQTYEPHPVELDITGTTYYNIHHQGDKKTLANTGAKVLGK